MVGDTGGRASPACVCGADHAGFGVGQEHRCTVGSDDTQKQAGPVRHERVGMGSFVMCHRLPDYYRRWRMDLVDAGKRRAGSNRVDREAAVSFDGLWIIAAAEAAIESRNRPC